MSHSHSLITHLTLSEWYHKGGMGQEDHLLNEQTRLRSGAGPPSGSMQTWSSCSINGTFNLFSQSAFLLPFYCYSFSLKCCGKFPELYPLVTCLANPKSLGTQRCTFLVLRGANVGYRRQHSTPNTSYHYHHLLSFMAVKEMPPFC
jgi:hypothetical protein